MVFERGTFLALKTSQVATIGYPLGTNDFKAIRGDFKIHTSLHPSGHSCYLVAGSRRNRVDDGGPERSKYQHTNTELRNEDNIEALTNS